ncbi:hypothetical protein U3A55_11900 [Salarchaeum sp. III]|uniref:hypothetical protein n=1 Tax=Salarchaeum sp. III TaxID=3107927 RepID=UPI002EDA0D36
MPVPYAHPVDVLRRFDGNLSLDEVTSDNPFGAPDVETIWARIRAVSQDWDSKTGTPLREVRSGSPGAPRTYEHHDADRTDGFPLRVELDGDDIVPLDPEEGDVLEIRTGRDTWENITDQEGDDWVLLHESGDLKLFQLLVHRVWWEAPDERYLRACYRYGALGGDRERGGQTTLSSNATTDASTLSVTDASRLPADGGVVYVVDPAATDATAGEYVRVTDVDVEADELTVVRGQERTDAASHDQGAFVHYCPKDVRDAVAAKTAEQLVEYDTSLEQVDGENASVTAQSKVDSWSEEYQNKLAEYSSVRRM